MSAQVSAEGEQLEHFGEQEELLKEEKEKLEENSPRQKRWWKLPVAVGLSLVWLCMLGAMPFFNHATFGYIPRDFASLAPALTPTIIQMLGASVLLVGMECGRHFCCGRRDEDWLFSRSTFFSKLWRVGIVGFIYAAVMGLTNVALQKSSVNIHVILKMSVIVWVTGFAWIFQGERPSVITLLCCAGLVAGTVLASWSQSDTLAAPAVVIVLTLASALAQGCMLVGTKIVLSNLKKKTKASLEIVSLKMVIASIFLLPVSLIMDPNGWTLLGSAEAKYKILVASGVVITASFQLIIVATQTLTLATSAGFLSASVIIPQVFVSLITNDPPFVNDALHILGYIVSPVSATLYAVYRFVLFLRKKDGAK